MDWIFFLGITVGFLFLIIKWLKKRQTSTPIPPRHLPRNSPVQKHEKPPRSPNSVSIQEVLNRDKDLKGIELNEDFKSALELIEKQNQSAFITGKAGTGKSTLLKYFRAITKKPPSFWPRQVWLPLTSQDKRFILSLSFLLNLLTKTKSVKVETLNYFKN